MKKNSVLRKVLVVSLAAAMLAGTGFTTVGQFVGTDVSVSATEVYGDFEYVVEDDNTIAITNYRCNDGDVVIPDTIDGKSVTSIGSWAFSNCTGLTSVTIGNSVTYIYESAFRGCTGLTSVTIGDSVTYIYESAFRGCTGLTSIEIPDSVTSIGSSVFDGCTGLTSINVGKDNEKYSSKDGVLFDKDKKTLLLCPWGKTGKYTIPDSVTSIGGSAFYKCTGLTSIEIPDSVTYIYESAFRGCKGLTSITIPDSVTSIGFDAFDGCTGLTSITIPDSVTYIGDWAFYNCKNLTSITIPDSVTYIGDYAFSNCKNLTSITIPDSVTTIGNRAFYDCTGLTSVTIGNSVTEIGSYAFYDCTGLTSVTIGNSVTYIGDYAFHNCTGLTSITIPDSVTSIGGDAFYKCTGLTSITIPDSVTSIGDSAFEGCTGLTSVTIGDSVTSIGEKAFYGCTDLTSITIPDSVTSIGEGAFYKCTGLTSITIPDSVTSIGYAAFVECTGLTSVTIGDSVTYIGDYAFRNCTGLTSITIPDSVTSIGYEVFYGCTGLTSITIPDSVTYIGDWTFRYCTGLTSITIPDSVTHIGDYAFFGCTGLTSITIPDSVTSIGYRAFRNCTGLTIYGAKGSYAETYANNNNIPFVEYATLVEGFAPTCTEQGKKDYYHNNFDGKDYEDYDCKKVITGDLETWRIIPAKGHSYKQTAYVAPTCTEDGKKDFVCTECGHTKTKVLPAIGHNYTATVTAPTCTEKGYTTYTCSVCGDSYIDEYTEPTGHSYTETVTAPTCTEKGYTTYTCSVCGHSYIDEYTEPTGHSYDEKVIVPTTEEEGYTLHTCENCGESYKDNYTAKLLANRSTLSAETISLGKRITVTATATGGTGEYLYQVLYKQKTQSKWTIAQDFGTNDTVKIKPASVADYDICVKVKDGTGKIVKKYFEVKVNAKLANTSTIAAENITLGQQVTVNGLATGGVGEYQYQVLYKQTSQSKWTTAQAFSENATVTFKPSKATVYDVCVKVKDDNGTIVKKTFTVQVNAKLSNTSVISATTIKKGNMVTVNGSATGGAGDYTYAVLYKQKSQSKWTTKQDFNDNADVSIKPAQATDYDICIKVKDKDGTIVKKYFTVTVTK